MYVCMYTPTLKKNGNHQVYSTVNPPLHVGNGGGGSGCGRYHPSHVVVWVGTNLCGPCVTSNGFKSTNHRHPCRIPWSVR